MSIKLYNEDCIHTMDRLIEEGVKIDLIVTDPPYDIKNTKTGGKSKLNESVQKSQDEISNKKLTKGFDYEEVLKRFEKLQDKTNIYIWCNKKQIPFYLNYFVVERKCSFDILKWVKTNSIPNYYNKYMSDTEYCLYFRKGGKCFPESYEDGSTLFLDPINYGDKKKYKHPTIKYEHHIERLIKNSSNEKDLVMDCFMGSGTTGVVSKRLNRNFIGVELDKEFFDISKERIENVSNRTDYKCEIKKVS